MRGRIDPLGQVGSRRGVFIAHVGPLLAPLLFAPAFLAVGWSLLRARHRARPHPPIKENP